MLISVLSEKGGVSKTTLTINLAHFLALKGYKVAIVDSDPQQSLVNFFHDREKRNLPDFCSVFYFDDLNKVREKKEFDVILMDCSPNFNFDLINIIKNSDFFVVLTKISQLDFYTLSSLLKSIDNSGKIDRTKIVLTQVNYYQTRLKNEFINSLEEYFNILPVATVMGFSNEYINSVAKFRTIFENKKNKKIAELQLIFDEILKDLENGISQNNK